MLHFSLIGNLGADAEVKNFNSGEYVSFRVAHNYRDGEKERTLWVSCLMRGNGGKLLDYLKKGAAVYVSGRGEAKTFSSHITKQFEVGLNVQVDIIQLISQQRKMSVETIRQALEVGEISAEDLKPLFDEMPF